MIARILVGNEKVVKHVENNIIHYNECLCTLCHHVHIICDAMRNGVMYRPKDRI